MNTNKILSLEVIYPEKPNFRNISSQRRADVERLKAHVETSEWT